MSKPYVLYRAFNAEQALLYVGITIEPTQRFRTHRRVKDWWGEVANISIETFETRKALAEAEREAIVAERPRYNLAGTRAGRAPSTPPMCSLRGVRRMLGYTAWSLSEEIRGLTGEAVPSDTILRVEAGLEDPTPEVLTAIAVGLGIPPEAIRTDFVPCTAVAS